jgi:hypothetical protein
MERSTGFTINSVLNSPVSDNAAERRVHIHPQFIHHGDVPAMTRLNEHVLFWVTQLAEAPERSARRTHTKHKPYRNSKATLLQGIVNGGQNTKNSLAITLKTIYTENLDIQGME